MTDQLRPEVITALGQILAPVPALLARGAAPVDVLPGSRLESDDAATSPLHLSHVIRGCLTHAVDHLEGLRLWLFEARKVPTWATFAVTRGAIENAATAVWLQSPDDQAMRMRRRIKLHVRDIRNGQEFRELIGEDPPRPAEERLAELVTMGAPFGISQDDVLGGTVGYARILADAGTESPRISDTGPLALWRMCSGLAHGQQWATFGVLDRQLMSTDDEQVALVKLTAPELPLVGAVNMAMLLTKEGSRLLDQHRLVWRESSAST